MSDSRNTVSYRVMQTLERLYRVITQHYRRCDLSKLELQNSDLDHALTLLLHGILAPMIKRKNLVSTSDDSSSGGNNDVRMAIRWLLKLDSGFLWELDLSQNELRVVPDALSQFDRLERLLLGRNRIKMINSNSCMPFCASTPNYALKYLQLSHNELSEIPLWLFESFPSLARLDLEHNQLSRLPIFNIMKLFRNEFKLRRMGLIVSDEEDWQGLHTRQHMTTVFDLSYMRKIVHERVQYLQLVRLNLSHNMLTSEDIPWTHIAESCPHLVELYLDHNHLTWVDQSVHYLRRLRFFTIDGNPLPNLSVTQSIGLSSEASQLRSAAALYVVYSSLFKLQPIMLKELVLRFLTNDVTDSKWTALAAHHLPPSLRQPLLQSNSMTEENVSSKDPLSSLYPLNTCARCGRRFFDSYVVSLTVKRAIRCQNIESPVRITTCSMDCAKAESPVMTSTMMRIMASKRRKGRQALFQHKSLDTSG